MQRSTGTTRARRTGATSGSGTSSAAVPGVPIAADAHLLLGSATSPGTPCDAGECKRPQDSRWSSYATADRPSPRLLVRRRSGASSACFGATDAVRRSSAFAASSRRLPARQSLAPWPTARCETRRLRAARCATSVPEPAPRPGPGQVLAPMCHSRSTGVACPGLRGNGRQRKFWSSASAPPYGSPCRRLTFAARGRAGRARRACTIDDSRFGMCRASRAWMRSA